MKDENTLTSIISASIAKNRDKVAENIKQNNALYKLFNKAKIKATAEYEK